MEFEKFGKLSRWSRPIIITEKLDGTNAQIGIEEADPTKSASEFIVSRIVAEDKVYDVYAGSRTRWLKPGKQTDNYGFAEWVHENAGVLVGILGEGRHYGEWWGQSIQRNYDLPYRRFSLFNVSKWGHLPSVDDAEEDSLVLCVPQIFQGYLTDDLISLLMDELKENGSYAAPGFKNPEGIVIFHTHGNVAFKKTFEGDEYGKGNV